jgi:hypothetical protein
MGKFDDIALGPGDFGDSASTHTILTGPKLEELFPTEAERKNFQELLKAMETATQSNQAQTDFIKNIGQFGGVALKLLRVVVPV